MYSLPFSMASTTNIWEIHLNHIRFFQSISKNNHKVNYEIKDNTNKINRKFNGRGVMYDVIIINICQLVTNSSRFTSRARWSDWRGAIADDIAILLDMQILNLAWFIKDFRKNPEFKINWNVTKFAIAPRSVQN